MESLQLDLSEDINRSLKYAPSHVKDEIEELQRSLLYDLKQYYAQKQDELIAYARKQLSSLDQFDDTDQGSILSSDEPKLKSIVKRRPSSSDKRVSFRTPPSGDSLHRETLVEAASPANGPDSYLLPAARLDSADEETANEETIAEKRDSGDSYGDRHGSANATGEDEQAPRGKDRPFNFTMPALDLRSVTRSKPKFLDDGTPILPDTADRLDPSMEPERLDHEDLFSFQEGDETTHGSSEGSAPERPAQPTRADESAQSHHSRFKNRTSPAKSHPRFTETAIPQRGFASRTDPSNQFMVGSAPISIRNSIRGLDGDGGPLPAAEEKTEEDDILNPSSFSVSQARMGDLNPATMSFSQRMEWETLRRRNGN